MGKVGSTRASIPVLAQLIFSVLYVQDGRKLYHNSLVFFNYEM